MKTPIQVRADRMFDSVAGKFLNHQVVTLEGDKITAVAPTARCSEFALSKVGYERWSNPAEHFVG